MKIEKQIERLKQLDKLDLFEFEVGIKIFTKYDDNGYICKKTNENCIIIKCLNCHIGSNLENYEEYLKFIKQFYRNLNKTLKLINKILECDDIKYGYESPDVYIYIKNVIEKYLFKEKLESQLTIKTIEKRSKI